MTKHIVDRHHIARRVLGAAAAAGLAACAQLAFAAGTGGGRDCANLAEVALVARALAEEKIDKPRAHSILRRIYEIPDEDARALARLVVESAYRDDSPAGEFALKLETVCMVNQGDVQSLLDARTSRTRRARTM